MITGSAYGFHVSVESTRVTEFYTVANHVDGGAIDNCRSVHCALYPVAGIRANDSALRLRFIKSVSLARICFRTSERDAYAYQRSVFRRRDLHYRADVFGFFCPYSFSL